MINWIRSHLAKQACEKLKIEAKDLQLRHDYVVEQLYSDNRDLQNIMDITQVRLVSQKSSQ